MKSTAEIAQLAREAGHEVSVLEQAPPADFPDGFWKFWGVCSCGWRSRTTKRAKKVATLDAIRHMVSVAADEDLRREAHLNGGTPRRVS